MENFFIYRLCSSDDREECYITEKNGYANILDYNACLKLDVILDDGSTKGNGEDDG